MTENASTETGGSSRQPLRVRLPGFIVEGDVGLGQAVKLATSLVGVKPCGACAERARRLDDRMVFVRRR